jgi:2-phosphosulfolactate phosphatase
MMNMRNTFLIDCLPDSAHRYRQGWAVVAVDVIRTTTMAMTAVAIGRRCYLADSIEGAFRLARTLDQPLLAGEMNGEMPAGFHMNNSPAELAQRDDVSRPLIILSSSGTPLIMNARDCDAIHLASFRNSSSLGLHLVRENYARIAILGAGSRGEFREEDQICCAWIGGHLFRAGYVAENETTVEILNRWANAKPADCLISRSVDYLRRTGQLSDLRFILENIDDIDNDIIVQNDEVVMIGSNITRDGRWVA